MNQCKICGKSSLLKTHCMDCIVILEGIDRFLESREGLHLILDKINQIKLTEELEKRGLKLDGTDK